MGAKFSSTPFRLLVLAVIHHVVDRSVANGHIGEFIRIFVVKKLPAKSITLNTTRAHIRSIHRKLNVHSRMDIYQYAQEQSASQPLPNAAKPADSR